MDSTSIPTADDNKANLASPETTSIPENSPESTETTEETHHQESASQDEQSGNAISPQIESNLELKESTIEADGDKAISENSLGNHDKKESSTPEISVGVRSDEFSDDDLSPRVEDRYLDEGNDEDEDEDDYDPEAALQENASEIPTKESDAVVPNELQSNGDSLNEIQKDASEVADGSSPPSDLENHEQEREDQNEDEDEDDYDPENIQVEPLKVTSTIPPKPPTSSLPAKPVGLPPKPPVIANTTPTVPSTTAISDPLSKLKEAYDAIMQSELVKDPNFINLSQQEQMKLIMEQLNKNNVLLTGAPTNTNMNYDQVYSYNKPFKTIKDPIPLVPVNEFCRRPNITQPMTPQEEEVYEEFIKKEAYYMGLQNWDEFPDKLRLFIGNLPANTISKQDLFRIFSQYGEVIQIAIKAGYGFAQFRTAEACLDCIKGETNVPLHNKIMRLDASKPQKTKRPNSYEPLNPVASRGRERSPDDANKRRRNAPDCQIYTTGKSSVFFIRRVKKAFSTLRIPYETEDITHRELSDVISEAAYSGVLGICVIKEMKVDVQTFESTPDGGVKFDEYADVEPEVAADIIYKVRVQKYGEPSPVQNFEEPDNRFSYGRRRGGGRDNGGDRRGGRNNRQAPYQSQGWSGNSYDQVSYGHPMQPNYSNPLNSNFASPPQQYGGYGQQNFSQQYQQPYPSQTPQPQSNQNNLIQAIQGLDPGSVQNVLNVLQNQQTQLPQNMTYGQRPQNSSYGNIGQRQAQQFQQAPPNTNSPNSQVNSLLSQLQSGTSSSYSQQQQAQPGSTQALMETLARLSRK